MIHKVGQVLYLIKLGIELWGDTSSYHGEYFKGKKHGLGVYIWSDGTKYEGEWQDNNLSGYVTLYHINQGNYYFNDGRVYSGQWRFNAMNGYGEYSWKDGRKYYGFYKNDKKEGFGICSFEDPHRLYIGFWKNGKQEGLGKFLSQNKYKYGFWQKGEKVKNFEGEGEALASLTKQQKKYLKYYMSTMQEILETFN